MGTRNLTCVVSDGEFKVAQYCQWDGYPSGQGATVLSFLKGEPVDDVEARYPSNVEKSRFGLEGLVFDLEQFRENVRGCYKIDEEDLYKIWLDEFGVDLKASNGMVNMEDSDRFAAKYPWLNRDLGGYILPYIQGNGPLPLQVDVEFAGDSLFCEYCYVVDLDTERFEFYQGFQKKSNNDRFAQYFMKPEHRNETYYSVALAGSWSLDDLPTVEDLEKLSPYYEG